MADANFTDDKLSPFYRSLWATVEKGGYIPKKYLAKRHANNSYFHSAVVDDRKFQNYTLANCIVTSRHWD